MSATVHPGIPGRWVANCPECRVAQNGPQRERAQAWADNHNAEHHTTED